MIYCFDANAFIGPWRRTYPPDVFADLWHHVDGLMRTGGLLIVSEAYRELELGGDDLHDWIKERDGAIVELNAEIQQAARDILSNFPGMINVRKQKSMADPFVVAHAQAVGGTIVTEESKTGDKNHPRIPDVCEALKINCLSPLGFIRAQGLKFRVG